MNNFYNTSSFIKEANFTYTWVGGTALKIQRKIKCNMNF